MAKKKVEPIIIKDEELMPTTLGEYSNKTKSPVVLFLIIILFATIAFFLPNIQNYLNNLKSGNNNAPTVVDDNDPDNTDPDPTNVDDDDKKYELSNDTMVEATDFNINSVTVGESTISINITSNKESLDIDSYYLELFDANNTFLGRVKLGSDKLSSGQSKDYTFRMIDGATQFSITKKANEDMPEVSLDTTDSGEAMLACSTSKGSYTYTFIDKYLTKVVYTYSAPFVEDQSYYSELTNYSNISNKLNTIDGVTASLTTSENGFTYTLQVDLKTVSDMSQLNDDNIYEIKTLAKVVKFKNDAKGYSCK